MALTFRKLEVFVAVAEDGNFRKAAERLGISQPSVSSQIKSMERYLGYQLFDRHRGATSELSPEGREFLSRARCGIQPFPPGRHACGPKISNALPGLPPSQ